MSREELIQHHIYVPEKLNYDDIDLHIKMGYRVVGYNSNTDIVRYISSPLILRRSIIPFRQIDRLEWRKYGLFYKTRVGGYYV